MNIGFDLRTIAQGKQTGVEEYALNILREISKSREDDFLLFYNAFFKIGIEKDILNKDNVFLKDFNVPNKLLDLFVFFNIPKLDKLVGGADVFFSPHFLSAPVSKDAKKVVTFHDLSFLHYPEFFSFKKKYWHFTQDPKKQAKEADRIIAISESTKSDLVNFYNIPDEKISVVYSGVDESFRPIPKSDQNLERVKKKYNLPENFILYLGTIEPRKNILGIIEAFEKVREKRKVNLVIAGTFGWLFSDIIKRAENSRFKDDIVFTGFVDQADKVYLYNLAEVFVYPSFFEGFGFPPLEAMACGVPIITSNCSSLPEVVGDAGIMIDPYKPSEIAEAIDLVLESGALRSALRERGIEQSKKFSWEDAGKKTLSILESFK
ncbi:glycosyltransferase family 4 protein [Candidatus Azambacteria bacterium]|nr:glycosyltransferase family 4 protein [Candidatus Azambacteria bacterium]